MYLKYWGLQDIPFQAAPDARSYVSLPTQEEALARMDFLSEGGGHLGLLLGAAGTGKTLLLSVFARRMRRRGYAVALVDRPVADPRHLLQMIATQLEPRLRGSESSSQLWDALSERLLALRLEGVPPLVLIDHLDQLPQETQAILYQLLASQPATMARLGVVVSLAGSGLSGMDERLVDLADLRMELEPWSCAETEQFIVQRLLAVGRERVTFEEGAIIRLHDLTEGIPRRVCQLAQLALAAGAGQSLHTVDEASIEAVCYELFSSPGSAPGGSIELSSEATWIGK